MLRESEIESTCVRFKGESKILKKVVKFVDAGGRSILKFCSLLHHMHNTRNTVIHCESENRENRERDKLSVSEDLDIGAALQ